MSSPAYRPEVLPALRALALAAGWLGGASLAFGGLGLLGAAHPALSAPLWFLQLMAVSELVRSFAALALRAVAAAAAVCRFRPQTITVSKEATA
jgi:hypothetical protein